jgi:lycopene cyclase domain-containing protein
MQGLYLWIDILTLAGPLCLSFDKRVAFYKNWKALFLSIAMMMLVFIPWDIAFTVSKIWGFNEDYLTGVTIFHLPIEEWLFFLVVPYACIFIYECCRAYFKDFLGGVAKPVLIGLGVVLIFFGVVLFDRWYTTVNFIGAGVTILAAVIIQQKNMGYLLLGFLISLIPFLLVNGILTGSFIEEPIVWYDDEQNLRLRILTIPLEDMFYLLFFFVLVLIPYEKLRHHS